MELDQADIERFDREGYLFFPGLLDREEAGALQRAVPGVLRRPGPEVVREKEDEGAVRLAFGAHAYSEPFGRLALLPRLLRPVQQLLRDEVYLHQSRLNPKQGFGGGASWAWHQDYSAWHIVDGMPAPRCVMAAVFVDDCCAAQSPLLVVPGSHRDGYLDEVDLLEDARRRGGYSLYHIDRETLGRLAGENGIEALTGPAGSVCFCHSILVHGSADNVSPWRRAIMYLIYNAVSNACTGTERAWYHNNRDFTPLRPIDDGALKGAPGGDGA